SLRYFSFKPDLFVACDIPVDEGGADTQPARNNMPAIRRVLDNLAIKLFIFIVYFTPPRKISTLPGRAYRDGNSVLSAIKLSLIHLLSVLSMLRDRLMSWNSIAFSSKGNAWSSINMLYCSNSSAERFAGRSEFSNALEKC